MTTAALYLKINPVRKILQNFSNGVNWKMACAALLLLALFLLIYYAWQINHLTGGTYLINSYQSQINRLSEEKKNLEVGFAESGFLAQVQQKIKTLNFQKTTAVKYIQIPASYLAKAK